MQIPAALFSRFAFRIGLRSIVQGRLNNEFGDANNFSDCEIFILPGRYAETGSTVREILTAFSKIDPEICKKIAFRHFENTATSSTFAVIEGEVYALSKDSSYGKRHDKNIPMDTEYHDFYTYGGPILQI